VTPITRAEFLLGKQLPYVALGMMNFVLMVLLAVTVFDVPLRGSFLTLSVGALVFVMFSTGFGLFASTFTRSQIAALFVTMIGTMIPVIQLNVDATRMSQAFTGSSYIQQMVLAEVNEYVQRHRNVRVAPVELAMRSRFNPNLERSWFGGLMEIINNITLVSVILTGAALIREREHGTIEHLLVMPVRPFEIMLSKVWSMGLVVLVSATFSLIVVVQGLLRVPIDGSVPLFLAGAVLHLFATTSMGIFLATLARSMPQFGLLTMLVLLPMQLLSGSATPTESMPAFVQHLMLAAPTTHFVSIGQAILFRGAGLDVVWPQFLALAVIGAAFFALTLHRFRSAVSQMV